MSPTARRATAEDLFAACGEDGRGEIVHGEIVDKALPQFDHGFAQGALVAVLGRRFNRPGGGRWPGGWWLATEVHVEYEPHELFCHDVVGWRRERVTRIPNDWPVRVRPDWVCEILSPGHEQHDRVDKLWVLHAAGVPHYWLLDHEARTLYVHRWQRDGYLLALTARAGDTVRPEPFDAAELRVATLFGDEPDDE